MGSVGLLGTSSAIALNGDHGAGWASFAYAATWLMVWLMAECRLRLVATARQ